MSYVRMQLANHTVRVGDVVEIWDGDAMIAAFGSSRNIQSDRSQRPMRWRWKSASEKTRCFRD